MSGRAGRVQTPLLLRGNKPAVCVLKQLFCNWFGMTSRKSVALLFLPTKERILHLRNPATLPDTQNIFSILEKMAGTVLEMEKLRVEEVALPQGKGLGVSRAWQVQSDRPEPLWEKGPDIRQACPSCSSTPCGNRMRSHLRYPTGWTTGRRLLPDRSGSGS